jgi:mono/diheme cytochrome c family protein
MKHIKLWLICGALLAALAGLALALMPNSFSARDTPTALEAAIASRLRRIAMPQAARIQANPLTPTPELLTDARRHYADHCAGCHSNDGSGNTPIGQNLYPKAPDMRQAHTQNLSDGEIYNIIHNGVRFTGMPAWGPDGPDEDSWKLVLFIRHLPQLTAEEIKDMEEYNPKSEADRAEEQLEEDFLSGKPVSPQPHHH